MYRRYEHLENKLEKELSNLEEKYRQGAEMTEGDLKRADMLAHTAKCLMAYEKMVTDMNSQQESYPNNNPYVNNGYSNGNSYMGNSYNSYNGSYMGNSGMDGNSFARDSMNRYPNREMQPMPGNYPMMQGEHRW